MRTIGWAAALAALAFTLALNAAEAQTRAPAAQAPPGATAAVEPPQDQVEEVPAQPAARCLLGAYVSALRDIDIRTGAFFADTWLWSVCPGSRDALESLDFINATDVQISLQNRQATTRGMWSWRKVSGTFRQHYDLTNYPFDRHTLVIEIEEGSEETDTLTYAADAARSRLREGLEAPGWNVADFRVRAGSATYDTTFGDLSRPPGAGSANPRLTVEIDIARDQPGTFLKLAAPLYLAAALALMSFLLQLDGGSYINPRLTLLGGVLFAAVLNMRSVDDVLGPGQGLTLLDAIHLVALALIIFATVVAALWSRLQARGWTPERVERWDQRLLIASGAIYVAVNVALIAGAMRAG